jgi:hypothetical protein
MRRQFGLLWQDPSLRMVSIAALIFGMVPGSIGPYQSLIAILVFGMGHNAYALLLMVALLVSVSAAIGIGIVTDQRPSRRRMAIFATMSIILGAGLVWIGHSRPVFILAHALVIPISGTVLGQLFAVARLASAKLPADDRAGILAIIRAIFAIPFVVILPLWGLGFEAGLSLLSVYPALVILGGLLLLVILRDWPRDGHAPWEDHHSGLGFRASLAELMAGPVLLRVLLIGAIHSGPALSGVILGLVFEQASGRGTGDVGLFFGLFVAIEVIVTLLVGQIIRHLPRLHIIALGVVLYAGFLALMPVLAATTWLWLLILPAGAGGALIYALAISYMQDLLGTRAGAGASLLALQRISADGLCAVIFALGSMVGGYGVTALVGAATMLAAMAAILWLDRLRDAGST